LQLEYVRTKSGVDITNFWIRFIFI